MKSEVLREIENSCDSIEDVCRKCSGIELDIYERAWLEDVKEEENARVTFVDHPPPRKKEAREREQPVKIFN